LKLRTFQPVDHRLDPATDALYFRSNTSKLGERDLVPRDNERQAEAAAVLAALPESAAPKPAYASTLTISRMMSLRTLYRRPNRY